MPLTDQEIGTYHQDGLVIPCAYRIPQATLTRIDELYQNLLEDRSGHNNFTRGHETE